MFSKIAVAAALLAAPLAQAVGEAIVLNQCSFPVYLWSVSSTSGPMVTIPASKGNYTEVYRANPNGGGISIKIATNTNAAAITQLEYTLAGSIWYDISNINGYPFENWGVTLTPSTKGCPIVVCPAGVAQCEDAYNIPTDNFATKDCNQDTDLVLVLCSGQNGTTISPSASSVASSAVSVASTAKPSTTASASASASTSTTHVTSTTTLSGSTTFVTSRTRGGSRSSKSTTTVPTTTAAPSTTAAPATTQASAVVNEDVVIITTYVTQWTTVDGSAPTDTVHQHAKKHNHRHARHGAA